MENEDKFRRFIAAGIFIVWVVSLVADAAMTTYEASAFVQAPFMLVAGWLFVGSQLKRNDDEDDKEKANEGS